MGSEQTAQGCRDILESFGGDGTGEVKKGSVRLAFGLSSDLNSKANLPARYHINRCTLPTSLSSLPSSPFPSSPTVTSHTNVLRKNNQTQTAWIAR